MKREQIIELGKKYIYADGDIFIINSVGDLMNFYDAILALPLDVPSDDEMMEVIWEETDVSLSLKDKEENTIAYEMYLEIIRWAIWMREEIIKRNQK